MKSVYDSRYAKRYIDSTLKNSYTKYKNEKVAEVITRLAVSKVLDVGGNINGRINDPASLRYQLASYQIDYSALDLNESYFQEEFFIKCGVPKEKLYCDLEYKVGSATDLPFEDSSIECITCFDVLEHIPNVSRAVSEFQRVLRNDGYCCVVVPSLYKLDCFNLEIITKKRKSNHLQKMSISDWVALLENDTGLQLLEEESISLSIASGLIYLLWFDIRYIVDPCLEKVFKNLKERILAAERQKPNWFEDERSLDKVRQYIGKEDILGMAKFIARELGVEEKHLSELEFKPVQLDNYFLTYFAQNANLFDFSNSVLLVFQKRS